MNEEEARKLKLQTQVKVQKLPRVEKRRGCYHRKQDL